MSYRMKNLNEHQRCILEDGVSYSDISNDLLTNIFSWKIHVNKLHVLVVFTKID